VSGVRFFGLLKTRSAHWLVIVKSRRIARGRSAVSQCSSCWLSWASCLSTIEH